VALSVIDLFAGPGGLNEGFSHVRDAHGNRVFRTVLSVECEESAHRTLELRALFRRLQDAGETRDYYRYIAGKISHDDLFALHRAAGDEAQEEALKAKLGGAETVDLHIEQRIDNALRKAKADECVLIGGPPCQAYSLVGRARRTNDIEFEADDKHLLYQHYLATVERFRPAVFLMENVPGLLSAKHRGKRMFELICGDLRGAGYELHPVAPEATLEPRSDDPSRFVVAANQFGVPQARSRVFILGLRKDLALKPTSLTREEGGELVVKDVIHDLPRIRSRLSREQDCGYNWQSAIQELQRYQYAGLEQSFREALRDRLNTVHPNYPVGDRVMHRTAPGPTGLFNWYVDPDCEYILNHNSRSHMRADLRRYFFWSEFAAFYGYSPKLSSVPCYLRPDHDNVSGDASDLPFEDRFRVQVRSKPSSTIMSHISKDGHYYIHYEPRQCRSLSVREAARLQTFPDNYFFEGAVTDQYKQVGNAVPPFLAKQIACLVHTILTGAVAANAIDVPRTPPLGGSKLMATT